LQTVEVISGHLSKRHRHSLILEIGLGLTSDRFDRQAQFCPCFSAGGFPFDQQGGHGNSSTPPTAQLFRLGTGLTIPGIRDLASSATEL
jgi:hypothetical protein